MNKILGKQIFNTLAFVLLKTVIDVEKPSKANVQ